MKSDTKQTNYCVISKHNGEKSQYAKLELEKYIYLLTGQSVNNSDNSSCSITFVLDIDLKQVDLGDEGYAINTSDDLKAITISAFTEQGLLYGVYGLLDEHFGVGFYFSGDAIPQQQKPLSISPIHQRKIPEQYIRGFLPWTNFPQSATSYSVQDWIYIIDQMTRMRMNFINIHNYNGEFGHNEVFHNIMVDGEMSRNWNATASKPHSWGMKGWDVNSYLFGGSDLFDDYDFGADATLHNDCLSNIDVFKKGCSEFKIILNYAHKRGVKIGLGLDLNLVAGDYSCSADNTKIAKARVNQIITDYPSLDYLMLYRSENSPDFNVWNNAFEYTYSEIKAKAANIRIAVSGWGLDPDTIVGLPNDIIAAPISGHGVNDKFPDGSIYGEREFWACPWAERDYNDSVHFAPYRTLLSNTIACYQNRSNNTKGLMTLTWRISDAVDAKLSYIAQAPWDEKNLLSTSEKAYLHYAKRCYGDTAKAITEIINQNEAYATNASECLYTPSPTKSDRTSDILKAEQQLAIIDNSISATDDNAWVARLKKLRCRIQAVKSFCIIDQNIDNMSLPELEKEFSVFVKSFINRIDDISSLGNLFSIENRYVQEWFWDKADKLNKKANDFSALIKTNSADLDELRVLVISPPTSLDKANFADFKAIVLNSTASKALSVSLLWRKSDMDCWNCVPMERRVKDIFGVRVPTSQFPDGVIEYCIKATDNISTAYYPSTAPKLCIALSKQTNLERPPIDKPQLTCDGARLRWTSCDGDALWYRIYRGTQPDFNVGPQSLVTYVYRDTLTYYDTSRGFNGEHLSGDYYYKVSCVDIDLCESEPSNVVICHIRPPQISLLKADSTEGEKTILLGKITLQSTDKYLCLCYGSTGLIKVDIWLDNPPEKSGIFIGTSVFCATGTAVVYEIGQIELTQQLTGTHEIYACVSPISKAQWAINSFYSEKNLLREVGITTASDCFAISQDIKQLRLMANNTSQWSVKAIDGSTAVGVAIDSDGMLTAETPSTVRVVSRSADGIERERLITACDYVKKNTVDDFNDFWIISNLIGCDESIEVGGLVNGYDYTCQLKYDGVVIYIPTRCAGGSFKIPSTVLEPNKDYEIAVCASNSGGYNKEITRRFTVTKENLYLLDNPAILGVKDKNGECHYTDEWKIETNGHYRIAPDGFHLSTGDGDLSARFTFNLPKPYTPQLPHLLVKAKTISGNWTMQLNYIPIVGPKDNGVAVRKDMRIFGFEPEATVELSFIVSADNQNEVAETIFESIQLLPDVR